MTSADKTQSSPARDDVPASLRTAPMILMYHAVMDTADDPNLLCVPPDVFAAQMSYLDKHGLRGVSIGMLVDAMRAGCQRGMVGITFDDGYVNVLEAALPVLNRHGFGATAFIIADRLGGTNEWDAGPAWPLLSGDGVRELAAGGIEIGSHSATHPRLAEVSPQQLTAEVGASRATLAALIGTEIRGFAYPYGSMNAAARAAVRQAGYEYACAVETSVTDISIMALPRVYVGRQDTPARMATKRLLYRAHIAVKGRHG